MANWDSRRQKQSQHDRQRARAAKQQAALNHQMQQMQQSYLNQLNMKGVGQMAAWGNGYGPTQQSLRQALNQMPTYNQLSPRAPNQPMNPPKYLVGYRVTIRTGKTVWTVHHFEERVDQYQGREVRYYYLEDEKGAQTRELEDDLKIFEGPASGHKAQVDFDTVVIEDEKRQQILEALEQVNQNDLIFIKWGFGDTIEKGRGVSMLFYGPPGTGKTLMAQAIANKLGYTLKVISTADVESSAPGEAERNIRKHFQEAKGGKTILLFDECDSLIYSRQSVGAILSAQINELLSQIERFDGITLFTTNRLGTLDEAVNRRLALKLEFAMPSEDERAEIWRRMFPEKAPVAKDVDFKRLAIVELTGGYIKNAVLRAARMAAIEKIADDKKEIKMDHLIKALKLEASSMVEFEEARDAHQRGYGHIENGRVVGNGGGGKTIKKTLAQQTMDRGQA